MKISTLVYTIKQGFVNIFRNKWFSLASVATISACLFLFGLFYSIVMNFQSIVKDVEEKVCISVRFVEGTTDERMMEIQQIIDGRSEVQSTEYISDEQALIDMCRDTFKCDPSVFLENPLEGMDMINVYMYDVAQQEELATFIESIPDVERVNRSLRIADTLTNLNGLIGYVSIGIIAILLAVSIFLISNTVAIGISVRSEEINIMKYIGATDFFVRSPFVLEGMLIGLVGAAIPLYLIYNLYDSAMIYVTERFSALSSLLSFLPADEVFKVLTPVSLAVGVGIGFLGSISTVRKHLQV